MPVKKITLQVVTLMDLVMMDDKLKEKVELSILFDFYGELLKEHNKRIFEDYILNDLSLSEIGDELGISRQGVYDIVKRCSKQLRDCEVKLCLVKKFDRTKELVNQIKILALDMKKNEIHQLDCMYQLDDKYQMDEKPQTDEKHQTDDTYQLDEIIHLSDNILKSL